MCQLGFSLRKHVCCTASTQPYLIADSKAEINTHTLRTRLIVAIIANSDAWRSRLIQFWVQMLFISMALSGAIAFPTTADTVAPENFDVQLDEHQDAGIGMVSQSHNQPQSTTGEVEVDESASEFIEQTDQLRSGSAMLAQVCYAFCFLLSVYAAASRQVPSSSQYCCGPG